MVLLLIYTSTSRNHLSLSFSLPLAPFPCPLAPLLPLPPSLASLPCYVLLFLAHFPCSLLHVLASCSFSMLSAPFPCSWLLIYTSTPLNHLFLSFSFERLQVAYYVFYNSNTINFTFYPSFFKEAFIYFQTALGRLVIIGHVANVSNPTLKTNIFLMLKCAPP